MSYGNNNYGNRQGGNGYRGGGGGYGNRSAASGSAGQTQGQRKDNSGSFKPNPNMSGPNSPNFKGSAIISGRLYFMSVWENVDKQTGVRYFKTGFTPADEANQSRPQSAPARGQGGGYQGGGDPNLDDAPF